MRHLTHPKSSKDFGPISFEEIGGGVSQRTGTRLQKITICPEFSIAR